MSRGGKGRGGERRGEEGVEGRVGGWFVLVTQLKYSIAEYEHFHM